MTSVTSVKPWNIVNDSYKIKYNIFAKMIEKNNPIRFQLDGLDWVSRPSPSTYSLGRSPGTVRQH